MQAAVPGCLEVLPATYSMGRAILAGLMVGAGTALGNGCTSGHGIAGLARYVRNLTYMCCSINTVSHRLHSYTRTCHRV